MQGEAIKRKEIKAQAWRMAKGVKTEANLEAVTRTLTKTLIETTLRAEMTNHLGYGAHDRFDVAPALVEPDYDFRFSAGNLQRVLHDERDRPYSAVRPEVVSGNDLVGMHC